MDFDSDCSNDSFNFLDFFLTANCLNVGLKRPPSQLRLPSYRPHYQFHPVQESSFLSPESSGQQQGQEQQNLPRVQDKSGMTSPKASRVRFSPETQREMSTWVIKHLQDSRLTREKENHFMTKCGATREQIRMAFNNRRQRIATPLKLMHQEQGRQMFLQQLYVAGAQIHCQYWIQPLLLHAHEMVLSELCFFKKIDRSIIMP
jgi:hypothetical protein